MAFYVKTSISNFQPWSGAKDTWETIKEHGKEELLESILEDLYPEGLEEGKLNDLLWFESDWILESLGIETED